LEIAPAKVLQGAVRLHGFTSSPTPETQVRVACALANELAARIIRLMRSVLRVNLILDMLSLLLVIEVSTGLSRLRRIAVSEYISTGI